MQIGIQNRREILNYILWYSEWGDRCPRNLLLPKIRTLAVDSQWTTGQDESLILRASFWILLLVTTMPRAFETATIQEVLMASTQMRRRANAFAWKRLQCCYYRIVCAFFSKEKRCDRWDNTVAALNYSFQNIYGRIDDNRHVQKEEWGTGSFWNSHIHINRYVYAPNK